MANVTNMLLPDGSGITSTSPRPGAPAPNIGKNWASTQFDSLPLPGGGTIGSTSNELLRSILHSLDIAEAHSAGRPLLCSRYNELLNKIKTDAGNAAVANFLANKG